MNNRAHKTSHFHFEGKEIVATAMPDGLVTLTSQAIKCQSFHLPRPHAITASIYGSG
jgi:hypothetical protein